MLVFKAVASLGLASPGAGNQQATHIMDLCLGATKHPSSLTHSSKMRCTASFALWIFRQARITCAPWSAKDFAVSKPKMKHIEKIQRRNDKDHHKYR